MLGLIYAVVNSDYSKVYIGSTTSNLKHRLNQHKHSLKGYQGAGCRYITVMEIIHDGDYSIELVEEYECDTRKQLLEREQFWIENTPYCVNTQRAVRTPEQAKEYRQTYHQERKEDPEYISKRVNYIQKPENKEKRRLKANETAVNRRADDPVYAAARTASYKKWQEGAGGEKRNAKRREQRANAKLTRDDGR